jgi:hypothetical protein
VRAANNDDEINRKMGEQLLTIARRAGDLGRGDLIEAI